ncbi:MAG: methyltransferase domain-containing protein [Proteobacteria bacterium]|nr:methyltransferase domain-containing protein [Pseudomonadota bacterium]
MSIDVVDLKEFYQSSTANDITPIFQEILKKLRVSNKNSRCLFVGFGAPYADQNKSEFLLMPAHIGVLAWPDSKNNRTLLAYEDEWPFADHMFDEIIVLHGLEYAQNAGKLFEECYRSLLPEGRLIVIVPNRRSIWVRSDKTPLGFGQPYTLTQLSKILKKYDFIPIDVARGLYSLPSKKSFYNIWSWFFELIASRALQKFSGLVGVVAIKRVYAGIPVRKSSKEARVTIAQAQTTAC